MCIIFVCCKKVQYVCCEVAKPYPIILTCTFNSKLLLLQLFIFIFRSHLDFKIRTREFYCLSCDLLR